MAASERNFELLDRPAKIISPAITKSPTGPGPHRVDHVWFAYRTVPAHVRARTPRPPTRRPAERLRSTEKSSAGNPAQPDWILRDVSFAIEPGQTAAIVGHTGAGKTPSFPCSCGSMMSKKAQSKSTAWMSKTWTSPHLRSRFGIVYKTPSCLPGRRRATSGWVPPGITDADDENAAEDVNLADFIRTLPRGFKEEVNERGTTLSTGQKQLISFARALAHDPEILNLDEATSSVDTETEFRVREALNRMVEGRTSVVIAHRLSTVQPADKIIVMHKGQVREIGRPPASSCGRAPELQRSLSTAIQRSGDPRRRRSQSNQPGVRLGEQALVVRGGAAAAFPCRHQNT